MRYSMVVYVTNMAKTLLEAADYMEAASDNRALCAKLSDNGRTMLEQMQAVLRQHETDLRSSLPQSLLHEAERFWGTGSSEAAAEALQRFVQCLPEEVHYQVRAVFFTGLGSTWDAMESVYAYMRDDPRFDPVVVLIPVFRQVEQNGQTKQEVTYVDYLTPLGVPFLEYSQYHLEDDCPDLAFTNQPYESVVLEQFWPENIAKHTRLVYLPYFTHGLIGPTTQTGLCQLPVYRVAWKVIGQSENHYRYYCRYAANGGGNMLVTGLPKWDPIIRLRTKPREIPASWEKKLQGRTVFLWNTVYDFNASSIPYFEKIYQWFQTHPDCALIWRTHPMTDTVTKLYYPEGYYARFQKYIAMTDEAPNMIFDREIYYEAAFCCSDAQISDLSSMMFQYLLLDKPVLYIETGSKGTIKPEFIIDGCWLERAQNITDILEFLEKIQKGIDQNSELRKLVRQRDIPLADGKSGERICEALWKEMHKKDMQN